MNSSQGNLSEKDHRAMDLFLGRVIDAYKNGELTKDSVVGGLAHVMAALDKGNTSEAVAWFNQKGVTHFQYGT